MSKRVLLRLFRPFDIYFFMFPFFPSLKLGRFSKMFSYTSDHVPDGEPCVLHNMFYVLDHFTDKSQSPVLTMEKKSKYLTLGHANNRLLLLPILPTATRPILPVALRDLLISLSLQEVFPGESSSLIQTL